MSPRPRKKPTRKVARNPSASSRRTPRYRQAKILPSIETDNPKVVESESGSTLHDNKQAVRAQDISRRRRTSISTIKVETVGETEKRSAKNTTEHALSDDDSEYIPSNEEDSAGEDPLSDQDDFGHRAKRSRTDNISSTSNACILSRPAAQDPRMGPGGSSSSQISHYQTTAPSMKGKEKEGEIVEHVNAELSQHEMLPAEASSLGTAGSQALALSLNDAGHLVVERVSAGYQAQKRPRTAPTTPLPSRPRRPTQGRHIVERPNLGESSSRNANSQTASPVQYLHTLTRTVLRAGAPPGLESSRGVQMNVAGHVKPESGNQHSLNSSSPGTVSYSAEAACGKQANDSRAFSRIFIEIPPGPLAPPTGLGAIKLVDCRNERNGLDDRRSNGKEKELQASTSQKCEACFKFRRSCDGAKPSCSGCTKVKARCIWPKMSILPPVVPNFSGLQLWGKCQSCAALEKQCAFDEDQEDCQNCRKRGWKCRPLTGPKPRKKNEYRGRNQDPNTKCAACVKARSHCDGVEPRCGHCEKWGYRCFPPGTAPPKRVPKGDKCKRCRQLKLACSETLPCPRCEKEGIPCGMTSKEEEMQSKFLGD